MHRYSSSNHWSISLHIRHLPAIATTAASVAAGEAGSETEEGKDESGWEEGEDVEVKGALDRAVARRLSSTPTQV